METESPVLTNIFVSVSLLALRYDIDWGSTVNTNKPNFNPFTSSKVKTLYKKFKIRLNS